MFQVDESKARLYMGQIKVPGTVSVERKLMFMKLPQYIMHHFADKVIL